MGLDVAMGGGAGACSLAVVVGGDETGVVVVSDADTFDDGKAGVSGTEENWILIFRQNLWKI